jgi:hypothetical protein
MADESAGARSDKAEERNSKSKLERFARFHWIAPALEYSEPAMVSP